MRSGNYMTQDRIIAVTSAARQILDWYDRMVAEIQTHIRSGNAEVSTDTINEMLARNPPSRRACEAIIREESYFSRRRIETNKIARERLQATRAFASERKQEAQTGEDLDLFEIKKHEIDEDLERENSLAIDLSSVDLHNKEELSMLHAKLKAACTAGPFLDLSEICKTLLIKIDEIDPILRAMISADLIEGSTMQDRFHIK